jgi:cytochrome c peroxidase
MVSIRGIIVMFKKSLKLGISCIAFSSVLACSLFATEENRWIRPQEVPQPKDNKMTPERIELGKLLYFDVRLSASNAVSCASCHHPDLGWSDATPKAVGHEGRKGPRNSPTVLNTAYQYHQFWDGRARTLEEQALGPIEADVEMNMPLSELIPKLSAIKGYQELFDKAYPNEGITKDTIAKAIATFERTVVSNEAPFDKYIKGDKNAISQEAQKGFDLFKGRAHCTDCHDGFNFTDGSFHNIGLNDEKLQGSDLGRYALKRRAAWYGAMKTPTLRDITRTAPYFHDGSVKTLHETVYICGNGGRYADAKGKSTFIQDRVLSRVEIDYIVEFLKTLTGPKLEIEAPTDFPK